MFLAMSDRSLKSMLLAIRSPFKRQDDSSVLLSPEALVESAD
jgi:hypothetical protein